MQHDWLNIFLLLNKSGAVLGEAWGPDCSVLTLAFLETLMSFPYLLMEYGWELIGERKVTI